MAERAQTAGEAAPDPGSSPEKNGGERPTGTPAPEAAQAVPAGGAEDRPTPSVTPVTPPSPATLAKWAKARRAPVTSAADTTGVTANGAAGSSLRVAEQILPGTADRRGERGRGSDDGEAS
ncbi:hypothetical protein BDK92_1451 [Micromonospora pisi]|uniref:Uncharacterized protein n=1 Tax=Micromonospora pisi TaxID=589240 RepID=A0A495JF62_9ACTN|nr:hypothetical protein BDK92_1451 [Micromonospora pisi]